MTQPWSVVDLTSESELVVAWNGLSDLETGGAAILSYNLQWDNATGGASWFDVIGRTPPSLLQQTSVTS